MDQRLTATGLILALHHRISLPVAYPAFDQAYSHAALAAFTGVVGTCEAVGLVMSLEREGYRLVSHGGRGRSGRQPALILTLS